MSKRFITTGLVALLASFALGASQAQAYDWSYGPKWSSYNSWKTPSADSAPNSEQDQKPSRSESITATRPNFVFQGYQVGLTGNTLSLEVDSVYNRWGLDSMSALLEGDTIPVRLGRGVQVVDSDGNALTVADLADADETDVIGRVGPKRRWMKDSNGTAVPTVLAKKIVVQSWIDDWADPTS